MSQSLLHQVTYSDVRHPKRIRENLHVSIPFTSGHVFRLVIAVIGILAAPAGAQMSQSLLHQVTYSDLSSPGFPQKK